MYFYKINDLILFFQHMISFPLKKMLVVDMITISIKYNIFYTCKRKIFQKICHFEGKTASHVNFIWKYISFKNIFLHLLLNESYFRFENIF